MITSRSWETLTQSPGEWSLWESLNYLYSRKTDFVVRKDFSPEDKSCSYRLKRMNEVSCCKKFYTEPCNGRNKNQRSSLSPPKTPLISKE